MMDTKFFDSEACGELARICEMSYSESEESVLGRLRDMDGQYESVGIVEADGHAALVVSHPSFLVAAFRGSGDIKNWLARVRTSTSNAFESSLGICGNFHTEIYDAAHAVFDSVSEAIDRSLGKRETPLYITGHSLGGAMANVFVVEMFNRNRVQNRDSMRLVTYGAPRVAERDTARAMNRLFKANHYRIAHCLDPVPKVPSKIRFRHAGRLVYINRWGVPMFNTTMLYRMYDGRAFDGLMGGVGIRDPLRSHEIESYVKAFEK